MLLNLLNSQCLFFRWINLISDDFRQLLYDQDEFALRLLFVFSSLCLYA